MGEIQNPIPRPKNPSSWCEFLLFPGFPNDGCLGESFYKQPCIYSYIYLSQLEVGEQ